MSYSHKLLRKIYKIIIIVNTHPQTAKKVDKNAKKADKKTKKAKLKVKEPQSAPKNI